MREQQTILIVLGTRPEAIKLAPLAKRLSLLVSDNSPYNFNVKVASTSQHRDMVSPILDFFEVNVDYDLDIMRENQTLAHIVGRTVEGIDAILSEEDVTLLIVQGDTSSALGAALAGFYRGISVAHVEAGLRSGKRDDPFPEEMNRRCISQLASLHLCPTQRNVDNLLKEGVQAEQIYLTGNTVIDALQTITSEHRKETALPKELLEIDDEHKLILVTTHRRENFGEAHREIFETLNDILKIYPDVHIAFPVHPNPNVRKQVQQHLQPHPNLHLFDPLDYIAFVQLMQRSWLIMTDSGGIQEEAPALGLPLLILRETTERHELIESGNGSLVGTSKEKILSEIDRLINDSAAYNDMAKRRFPFGEGDAVEQITRIIVETLST